MKNFIFSVLFVFILVNFTFSQQINSPIFKYKSEKYIKINSIPNSVALGIGAGLAKIESNSGMSINLFAEIKTETFSFLPQATYWKTDDMNNFEISGLARLRLKAGNMEPYFDGGIGINFLNTKTTDKNDTKLGLNLGGGVDFIGVGTNYIIFADAKYKIIVGDPNVKGFILSGGIKFTL